MGGPNLGQWAHRSDSSRYNQELWIGPHPSGCTRVKKAAYFHRGNQPTNPDGLRGEEDATHEYVKAERSRPRGPFAPRRIPTRTSLTSSRVPSGGAERPPRLSRRTSEGGAHQMLRAAPEAEAAGYVGRHAEFKGANGRRLVVRNGHVRPRVISTDVGPLGLRPADQRQTSDRRRASEVLERHPASRHDEVAQGRRGTSRLLSPRLIYITREKDESAA